MRPLLLSSGLLVAVALTLTGCDSVGLDDGSGSGGSGHPCTTDCGGGTGGSGGGDGKPGDGKPGDGGGSASGAVPVDARQTYLRTHEAGTEDQPLDAPALDLADLGLAPGQPACFEALGDFVYYDDLRARDRDARLVTGVFSSSATLLGPDAWDRVPGALDAGDDVYTESTYRDGLGTDIAQDFDATSGCVTVPDGAKYLFLAPWDNLYRDNADALVDGQPFRVAVSRP